MTLDQLAGKFARLQTELTEARSRRGGSSHVERLIDELAATRREVSQLQACDEQSGDSAFVLNW